MKAQAPAVSRSRVPGVLRAHGDRPAGPWPDRAGAAIIALATATLLGVALFLHPVGDYYAESDFYGGYAAGARQVQHGILDPHRYVVVGPVYEVALALLGGLTRDLFLAGKLISVAAAAAARPRPSSASASDALCKQVASMSVLAE